MNTMKNPPSGDQGLAFQTHALQMILFGPFTCDPKLLRFVTKSCPYSSFKELSAQFASHFIGGHRYKKSTACLMNIKQREDKTQRSNITRFNKEALSIDEVDDKIFVAAFTNGLWKEDALLA